MKIRKDFVTNSSSSSYVIGTKGELTKEKLIQSFGVTPSSLLFPIVEDMANILIDLSRPFTLEQLAKNWCCNMNDLPDIYQDLVRKGYNLHIGFVGSDGEYLEQLLYNMSLNYIDEDFAIYLGEE